MMKLTILSVLVLWAVSCAHEPALREPPKNPAQVAGDTEVRAAASRFLRAAEQHDFTTAFALLSGSLRERYTPERLAHDFETEPLAGERLARIRAAMNKPFAMTETRAVLSLGPSLTFTLVHESDGWRVAALE